MADLRNQATAFYRSQLQYQNEGDAFKKAQHLAKMVEIQQEINKTMSAAIDDFRSDLDMADLSTKLEGLKADISAVENMVRTTPSRPKRAFGEEEVFTRDLRRRVSSTDGPLVSHTPLPSDE